MEYLHNFGEMAVIRDIKTIKKKLDNRGKVVMFLGYAKKHSGNVFRFLNITTKKVVLRRNNRFRHQRFFIFLASFLDLYSTLLNDPALMIQLPKIILTVTLPVLGRSGRHLFMKKLGILLEFYSNLRPYIFSTYF